MNDLDMNRFVWFYLSNTPGTRSMLYKQHPDKQQLVIAVKFYILLLKSE